MLELKLIPGSKYPIALESEGIITNVDTIGQQLTPA